MDLEHWPLDRLIEYARNPRKNDQAVDRVASAIREFGFKVPVVARSDGTVVDGHLRLKAARKLGLETVPVLLADDLTEAQVKAFRISVNRMAELADWDLELLRLEFDELKELDFDLDLTGFDEDDLASLFPPEPTEGLTDEDAVPEVPEQPVTVEGDVWVLGRHRVMCGDSTSIDAVKKLMAGAKAALLHADPPYGMGKEGEGVANDNLYRDKLDAFQMEWWATFRTFLEDNASAYIWGNAPDLWRLWYLGGLTDSERMTMRNEITWVKVYSDKGTPDAMGQGAEFRSFAPATERCLFFMLGEQGFNNNADNYWEGWEPIREYLESEMKRCGWGVKDLNQITSTSMGGHWVTKSQWGLITAEHYAKIQEAARDHGAFKRDHDELKREFYATRAYFDNAHDNMTDVWEFQRVTGEERHGHATPKPVEMMERVMRSSLPTDGLCVEPFGGSGSTLMAAEKTKRICYTMELQAQYCDVIIRRWEQYTNQQAILESDGRTFAEVSGAREAA